MPTKTKLVKRNNTTQSAPIAPAFTSKVKGGHTAQRSASDLRTLSGELLSSSSVAKLCGVTSETVCQWRKAGKLKPAVKRGTWFLFKRANLAAILRAAIGCGYASALLALPKNGRTPKQRTD